MKKNSIKITKFNEIFIYSNSDFAERSAGRHLRERRIQERQSGLKHTVN